MRKIFAFIIMVFISVNIIFLHNVLAEDINPITEHSPIKGTFDKKIIIWRFDDISVRSSDSIINRFVSMTENVTKYGGYVGWGFVSGMNEIIHYPEPQNLTYTKKNIDKFKNLTLNKKVSLWLHCWNHSWYTGENGISVWEKDIKKQREALNYTIWTFYNNIGYYPPIFSAGGSRGNVNTTVVLAERDLLLLYGNSNYEPPDKRLRYLTLPSSKDSVLINLAYHDRENLLDDMKATFINKYNNYSILQVMLHPGDWNESAIPIFEEFTDWVYKNHDLVNMNFTDAYNYKHDIECLQLDKQNDYIYKLNFYNAFNPLNITWSEKGNWTVLYTHNQTKYGELNISFLSDTIEIKPNDEYTIRLASAIIINNNSTENQNKSIPFINTAEIFLITIVVIYGLFKSDNRKK